MVFSCLLLTIVHCGVGIIFNTRVVVVGVDLTDIVKIIAIWNTSYLKNCYLYNVKLVNYDYGKSFGYIP